MSETNTLSERQLLLVCRSRASYQQLEALLDKGSCLGDENEFVLSSHPTDASHANQTAKDHDKAPTRYLVTSFENQQESASNGLLFDMRAFLQHLQDSGYQGALGQSLFYADAIGSTQTLLEKNYGMTEKLPNGFMALASHQLAGRGRSTTTWLSAPGCLQFSFKWLHHDYQPSSLILYQYYIPAILLCIIVNEPGYERLPLKLKWPNDVYYVDPDNATNKKKLGGVLVQSNLLQERDYLLIIGTGFNVENSYPTFCLNDVIRETNARCGTALQLWSREKLLAKFCAHFESYVRLFEAQPSPKGFDAFQAIYAKYWMHLNARVQLQDEGGAQVDLIGIHPQGYLRAKRVDTGAEVLLQPGECSFDVEHCTIQKKK